MFWSRMSNDVELTVKSRKKLIFSFMDIDWKKQINQFYNNFTNNQQLISHKYLITQAKEN